MQRKLKKRYRGQGRAGGVGHNVSFMLRVLAGGGGALAASIGGSKTMIWGFRVYRSFFIVGYAVVLLYAEKCSFGVD